MTTITTNTAPASKTTPILSTVLTCLTALKPSPKSPKALLAAQTRRFEARAAADRLLR